MPLLDIESFLGPMLQDNPSEKISLLLLYAVMCSGAAHVDICALQALGYKTRKAARRAFFERARLLYDFDCEPDRVSLVQAFLLMTYWWDTGRHHKDRRFWVRESVSLAQDLGLDLDLDKCSSKRRRLLKRVWWCCFMRDQFVALMTWTPAHLGARYRRLPMLVLDDFEIEGFTEAVSREFSQWPLINDRETRVQLATLCIEKAKLCLCINQIIQVRYASLRHGTGSQMITILVPKHAAADPFEVVEYDQELQKWYHSLSDSSSFDLRDLAASTFTKGSEMVALQRGHLKLLFLSAMLALHRPQVSDRSDMLPSPFRELSRTKLREVADEVAHIASCLKNLGMGTHMSPRGITLFLPILLVHLQDIRPEIDSFRGPRLEKYHECMRILDSIGDMGASEGSLPAMLETAFRELNILPVADYRMPQAIFMKGYENLSDLEDTSLHHFSNLGAMTDSEATLLNELSSYSYPMPKPNPTIFSHYDQQTNLGYMALSGPAKEAKDRMTHRQQLFDLHTPAPSASMTPTTSNFGHPRPFISTSPLAAEVRMSAGAVMSPRQDATANFNAFQFSSRDPDVQASSNEEDAMERLFEWKMRKTNHPGQKQKIEEAYHTAMRQMWTLDDLRSMDDMRSDLYRLAIQEGIPDGMARSFRRELAALSL